MRTFTLVLLPGTMLLSWSAATKAQSTLQFQFTGVIEFQQGASVPGLGVGDIFQGSFVFDPAVQGTPHMPPDNTLDTSYHTVLTWNVGLPASGLMFAGVGGVISVGNNSPQWGQSDRYIVTMVPDPHGPSTVIDGHTFSFFQIDLFDEAQGSAADLLADSSLPAIPPDLARVQPFNRGGRFVFGDASFQNQIISISVVPEPGTWILLGTAGLAAGVSRAFARRRQASRKHSSERF